jgi:hypothetical protein
MDQLSLFPEDEQKTGEPSEEPQYIMPEKAYYIIKSEDITSLVMDFVAFCEYIMENHPRITDTERLNREACFEINKLLSNREDVPQATYPMERYVAIWLFFSVAKGIGLIRPYGKSVSHLEMRTTENYNEFLSFNVYTKYLILLYGWMLHIDTSKMSDDYALWSADLGDVIDSAFKRLAASNEKRSYKFGSKNIPRAIHNLMTPDSISLSRQMPLLGIIQTEEEMYANTGSFDICISRLRPTPLGISLARVCLTRRFTWINEHEIPLFTFQEEKAYEQFVEDYDNDPGRYFAPFVSMFPPDTISYDVLMDFLLPNTIEEKDAKKMVFHFKVSLSRKCYRIIQCLGNNTFEDLHNMIQKAFQFDNSDSYSFCMDGNRYSRNQIVGFFDMCPFACDVMIGEEDLYVGKKFSYLFDVDSDWVFNITVVHFEEEGTGNEEMEILKSVGDAPSHYIERPVY